MSRNHEGVEAEQAETMRHSTHRAEGKVVGWLGAEMKEAETSTEFL